MKLTPWFPPEVKPKDEGWYGVGWGCDCPNENYDFAYYLMFWWDGDKWRDTPNGKPCQIQERWWYSPIKDPEKSNI